jgi:hypothetical protein
MSNKKIKRVALYPIISLSVIVICILIAFLSPKFNFAENGSNRDKIVDSTEKTETPLANNPQKQETLATPKATNSTVEKKKAAPTTPVKNQVAIGTNLSAVNDYATQLSFLDGFKASRDWITQNDSQWDTQEEDKLDLDENGWVKSLPTLGSPAAYTRVATLLYVSTSYKGGQYIARYDGEGTIDYGFDAKKNLAASTPGRDVLDVTPTNAGIVIRITATDPNKTGNYLRNISVVPAAYEKTYKTEIFNPEFVEKVKDFTVFRFMEWMEINNSTQGKWSDRPTPNSARYSSHGGVPLEIMVEFANRNHRDPWFCIPHMATDEYVANFARYVKENLEPQRKVYVEYSNEVWNGMFWQSRWVMQRGKQEFPNLGGSSGDFLKTIAWYSKRTTEITRIWDEVFGEDKDRVIGIMSGQGVNPWVLQQELKYLWTDKPLSHAEYGIDAIAIAPYFGFHIGSPKYKSQVSSWASDIKSGLDKLFEELTEGGVLPNAPKQGALKQAYQTITDHAKLAKQENLQLLAYETGQHLAGTGGVENNNAITRLFIEANRDPRMGEIYRDYIAQWFALGGGLYINFNDISRPSKWGSWGILERVSQTSSPKYEAVLEAVRSLAAKNSSKNSN